MNWTYPSPIEKSLKITMTVSLSYQINFSMIFTIIEVGVVFIVLANLPKLKTNSNRVNSK